MVIDILSSKYTISLSVSLFVSTDIIQKIQRQKYEIAFYNRLADSHDSSNNSDTGRCIFIWSLIDFFKFLHKIKHIIIHILTCRFRRRVYISVPRVVFSWKALSFWSLSFSASSRAWANSLSNLNKHRDRKNRKWEILYNYWNSIG